jgi:hypothetical protein
MDVSRGRLTDDTAAVHTPCVHDVCTSFIDAGQGMHAPYAHYTHVRTRRDDRRSRAVRSIDELSSGYANDHVESDCRASAGIDRGRNRGNYRLFNSRASNSLENIFDLTV